MSSIEEKLTDLEEVSDDELLSDADGEIILSDDKTDDNLEESSEDEYTDNDEKSNTDSELEDDVLNGDENEISDPWISESQGNINTNIELSETSESDESDFDEDELKKIDKTNGNNILLNYHPELEQINYKELTALSKITKNKLGHIIDPLHQTLPILTRYEQAKVLGVRAKQINNGSKIFVNVGKDVIEGHTIALMELKQKKIPFIIRRPLPNGRSEYWNIKDLEML